MSLTKRERTALQEKNWNTSTITQLSVTWSGTYITYYPVEGMRPQSISVIFCSKFITFIQLKRKRQTQTEAFATKYWALIEEGNGNPLQCSCLENPMDGEAWWAAVIGVAQSQTRLKWLSSSNWSLSIKVLTVPEWGRLKRHDNLVPHVILGRVVWL